MCQRGINIPVQNLTLGTDSDPASKVRGNVETAPPPPHTHQATPPQTDHSVFPLFPLWSQLSGLQMSPLLLHHCHPRPPGTQRSTFNFNISSSCDLGQEKNRG